MVEGGLYFNGHLEIYIIQSKQICKLCSSPKAHYLDFCFDKSPDYSKLDIDDKISSWKLSFLQYTVLIKGRFL